MKSLGCKILDSSTFSHHFWALKISGSGDGAGFWPRLRLNVGLLSPCKTVPIGLTHPLLGSPRDCSADDSSIYPLGSIPSPWVQSSPVSLTFCSSSSNHPPTQPKSEFTSLPFLYIHAMTMAPTISHNSLDSNLHFSYQTSLFYSSQIQLLFSHKNSLPTNYVCLDPLTHYFQNTLIDPVYWP